MKIGHALGDRKRIQQEIIRYTDLLRTTMKDLTEEGRQRSERLIETINDLQKKFLKLTISIEETNAATEVEEGKTLKHLLLERDYAFVARRHYEQILSLTATGNSALSPESIAERIDNVYSQWNRLNEVIQEINWATDLIES